MWIASPHLSTYYNIIQPSSLCATILTVLILNNKCIEMFEELMKCEFALVTVKVISNGSHTRLPILGKRENGWWVGF